MHPATHYIALSGAAFAAVLFQEACITMTDKETLAAVSRKIKALLQRTQENGCTEAEAAQAALKAHELLAKYQLELSELDLREEGTSRAKVKIEAQQIELNLGSAVGEFCDCKVWRHKPTQEVNFLGLKSDVFFAEWLLRSLAGFVQRETFLYSLDTPASQGIGHLVESFKNGMILRINERLNAETQARQFKGTTSGRDLVPLKSLMIAEAFEATGIRLSRQAPATRAEIRDRGAFEAGQKRGDAARFARPLARDFAEPRQLTKQEG